MPLWTACLYILVGLTWGCTNPFLKRAHEESVRVSKQAATKPKQGWRARVWGVVTNPALLLPYGLNQCGSFLFYFLSAVEPVQRAAPVCNTLTFVLTAVTAHFALGEEVQQPFLFYSGVLLVSCGVAVILAAGGAEGD